MSLSPIEIFSQNFKYRKDVTECMWITRTYFMNFLTMVNSKWFLYPQDRTPRFER